MSNSEENMGFGHECSNCRFKRRMRCNFLIRRFQDKNDFIKTLKEERKTIYKQKLKEFDEEVKDERVKRLGARKAARKEERRSKYIKEKEEAAQKEAEERMKREREEEKRKAEEEYEEKMRKLEEIEERKREREREVERKIEEDKKRRIEDERKREQPASEKPVERESWRAGETKADDGKPGLRKLLEWKLECKSLGLK